MEQMNDTETLFIYSKFAFWIVLGMMIYLAGGFFIYIFTNQLNTNDIMKYWVFTNICGILRNVFFAIAIITYNTKRETQKSIKNIHAFQTNYS